MIDILQVNLKEGKRDMYKITKRAFDLSVALTAGSLLLPLSLVVAVLLYLTQGRVLFRQTRPGLHGKVFTLYKFCSMNDDRDSEGNLLPDEQRLTWVGSKIRSFSLDELPQLWNVICGDMSIVGPRPLLVEYLDRYSPEQARRHQVKPGITGWAQVNGRNAVPWSEKLRLDVWYVDHASFWLDMKVVVLTILAVVFRSGIAHHGHVSMPAFHGEDCDAN